MSKIIGIVGTVPDSEFPLLYGRVRMTAVGLDIEGKSIPVNRGTPALLAAAVKAADMFDGMEIHAFLVGDIGRGSGSRRLYQFLSQRLAQFDFQVLAFHYLQPEVDWHNKVLFAVEAMKRRPILIADAGFMYAAKMSGQAAAYDFFTPDMGELAFLADESAPHPFYTRGFILHQNNDAEALIRRAYQYENAASHLLVKGETDYIVKHGEIIDTVAQPASEAMEAIGGTGDTLTGLLSVLCATDFEPVKAAALAAQANRYTGRFADPTPATQIGALIDMIPRALSHLI